MARRQRYQVSDEPQGGLYVASAEDIILQKLHWYRLGGNVSERQWNDVLGVLQVQNEKLDIAYLWRRAKEMEVQDLLEQAVRDGGIDFKGT